MAALTALNAAPSAGVSARPAADVCVLTVLIPCLNEAETIGICVSKAATFLAEAGVSGEVLVADNGSTDESAEIAAARGACVVHAERRGYGAALAAGIAAARGRYIIMGDADDSYDLRNLGGFLRELQAGADLVIGNRFRGGIETGAMPLLHRYLGNPVLTTIGRLLFGSPVKDFHCGLRGFSRASVLGLRLQTTGMEFASEMVVRASLAGLRIVEVPTTLKKDGRDRAPHLRTWRDGWLHLRFLLLHSPRWTFGYPGLMLVLLGGTGAAFLANGPLHISADVSLDIHTFLIACIAVVLGIQSLTFGVIARRYAKRAGLLPPSRRYHWLVDGITLEMMLRASALLLLAGGVGLGWSFYSWGKVEFGALPHDRLLRLMIVSTCSIAASVQLGLSAFLVGLLDLPGGDVSQQLADLRQIFGDVPK
ncbi:MAG: glycosyltransferase family 2 protein [Methylovirgula sp.]